jgi:protease II
MIWCTISPKMNIVNCDQTGGELGLTWHAQGRRLQKRQTFLDFVSCGEYLIDEKYTTNARMAAKGTSAGGLIMGFLANEHPHLFQALVMSVPFLDLATTMQDPTLPLTIHEYDEWGDPNDSHTLTYMQSYSPCDNLMNPKRHTYSSSSSPSSCAPSCPHSVHHHSFPSMLITTALNDTRVPYWESIKWTYLVRQRQQQAQHNYQTKNVKETPSATAPIAASPLTSSSIVWLKVSEEDGHFGGQGRLDQLQGAAFEQMFLHKALGLITNDNANGTKRQQHLHHHYHHDQR